MNIPLRDHPAEGFNFVVQKRLLALGQRRRLQGAEGLPVGLPAEQRLVPAGGTRLQSLTFGAAHRRHGLAQQPVHRGNQVLPAPGRNIQQQEYGQRGQENQPHAALAQRQDESPEAEQHGARSQ